jgi:hypothetical protein
MESRAPEQAPRARTTSRSLMLERLRLLSAEDRTLVELAALCGSSQPPSVLMSAAATEHRNQFNDLCSMRLLRWTGVGEREALQIYHDRLREFVVDALDPEVARRHHLALVSAMEEGGGADAQEMMAHAVAAGDRRRAGNHAMSAARQAEAALAFDQSARLYRIALDHAEPGAPRAELHASHAEAMANAGHSIDAAPEFERAVATLATESPEAVERRTFLRRRAGEQYLKAGHFEDGLRLMETVLADADVSLPKTGQRALAVSAMRRARLYLGGFAFRTRPPETIAPRAIRRLDHLWAATTALSMMDPVRADSVGLLHFLESLQCGDASHVARSLGYEAAFAALIGGPYFRKKARHLLALNARALGAESKPYERHFYVLGRGASAFFHSDWRESASACDAAARGFRSECRGAEYEAAVATVFHLQALGQAGRVSELVARIPAAIREAEARGDVFAANNCRAGFHALGRIAAGQIGDVQRDLQNIVVTWKPGLYQMHAYHRVLAGVAADLYVGEAAAAAARIEDDWQAIRAGLFLNMELPAAELRWTRARAALALAATRSRDARQPLLAKVQKLAWTIGRATVAAAPAHAALLRAGVAAIEDRPEDLGVRLREALAGYTTADMAIHREVARWNLSRMLAGSASEDLKAQVESWMRSEGVPDMAPLTRAVAPGLEEAFTRSTR